MSKSKKVPHLEFRNLAKSFGQKEVLRDISFSVERGESVVIVGGSGSGKSITLKMVLGLLEPTAGEILIHGKNKHEMSGAEWRDFMQKFGMLFQGGALFDSLPVWRNVAFAVLNQRGMSKKEAKKIAIKKLESVGLYAAVADQYPAELSGGMQKRVALARAIATKPELIFFDEPTTGLDPIMADVINQLIRDQVTKLGATALTITHDMASVQKIADKVAMLYQGEIIWFGPVEKLFKSGNDYVDQFVNGRAEGPIEKHKKVA